jgi:hypothetical protein
MKLTESLPIMKEGRASIDRVSTSNHVQPTTLEYYAMFEKYLQPLGVIHETTAAYSGASSVRVTWSFAPA